MTMALVRSPSRLSEAVAPSSIYAVPASMNCGLAPVRVMTGAVASQDLPDDEPPQATSVAASSNRTRKRPIARMLLS